MDFGEHIKNLRKEKELSQKQLSQLSGISTAEISRIETGDRQKPSPDVLKVIAPFLGVKYEDLMDKAGYLHEESLIISERKDNEEKFIEIITPKLIKDGWSVELCSKSYLGDLLAKKDKLEWYLDFKHINKNTNNDRNFRDKMMYRNLAWQTYGRLALYEGFVPWKYTIVTDDQVTFNNFVSFVPHLLKICVSVMLIDINEKIIVVEQQLT